VNGKSLEKRFKDFFEDETLQMEVKVVGTILPKSGGKYSSIIVK